MISQIFLTAMIKCPNQSGLRLLQTKSLCYICYQSRILFVRLRVSCQRGESVLRTEEVSSVFINFVLFQRLPMNYKQDPTMRSNLGRNQRKQFSFCSKSCPTDVTSRISDFDLFCFQFNETQMHHVSPRGQNVTTIMNVKLSSPARTN